MSRSEQLSIPPMPGGSTPLAGVLARPDHGDGPWPGVVMVHEAWGLDDVLRRQADRLADAGYLVLAPDLYTSGRMRCLVSTFQALRAGKGRPFADIDAARAHLAAQPACTGRVGIIGFCMGGGFALVAATDGYAAASVNYGEVPDDYGVLAQRSCPVVGSYGARDRGLRGHAARLEAGLVAAGVEHDVKEYPSAGHAFVNDAWNGPVALRPLLRIMGAGPDPQAAADAWRRIEAFFARHLAEATSA